MLPSLPEIVVRTRYTAHLPPRVLAPASHSVLKLPNGLRFRVPAQMRGAAKFLIREIFHRRRYFRPGFGIRPTDTVVDIGANMGLFALWAAPQASLGRVIAVEPTGVLDALEENTRFNGISNIAPLRVAVGRDGEQTELVHYPGFNIVSHQPQWRPATATRAFVRMLYGRYDVAPVRVTAPCMSLRTILESCGVERVNFLKVDCEGAEYEMMRDLARPDWERIERLAMEFHELHPGHRHQELVALLRKQGFEVAVRKPWLDYYVMRFGEIWAWRKGASVGR